MVGKGEWSAFHTARAHDGNRQVSDYAMCSIPRKCLLWNTVKQQVFSDPKFTFSKEADWQQRQTTRLTFSKETDRQQWHTTRFTSSKETDRQQWHTTRFTFSKETDWQQCANDTLPDSQFSRETDWEHWLTFSIGFLQKSVENDGHLPQERVCADTVGTQHSQFQLGVGSHQP